MNKIYISQDANKILIDYLQEKGKHLEFISSINTVDREISNHPDVFLCKMGIRDDSPMFSASADDLGVGYPDNSRFNAACTGKFFIHNLAYTNERLLLSAKNMEMILVNVRQGYTKCSTTIVDENSIITYDEGIARACSRFSGLEVLLISPGNVLLPGHDTGFIGGTSGRIGNEIVFNGDLSLHPDFDAIRSFIEKRGLTCKWFSEYPLTDIGSIL